MKIQLASTLPFTPVQLDAREPSPRRTVGQLHGVCDGVAYRVPVYAFRHTDDDVIHYQIDPSERVYIDENHALSVSAANDSKAQPERSLVWVEHDDSVSYKPYAFLVMDAMTRLIGGWDGIVYRTPSGERLRESAFQATLRVVDACVCPRSGLWVMVDLGGGTPTSSALNDVDVRQLGWVHVAC